MSRVRVGLDFNCAPRLANALDALYGHRGFEFVHMERLVRGRTADEIWADAFKKFGGRAVISGDANIAFRPHQAVAFIDNGFTSFFPEHDWCHLKAHRRSAVLVAAWPAIETKIAEGAPGTCWRIPCRVQNDGELRLAEIALRQMEIPQEVLERARRQLRAAG